MNENGRIKRVLDWLGLTTNRNRLDVDKPKNGAPEIFGAGLNASQQAALMELKKKLNSSNTFQ